MTVDMKTLYISMYHYTRDLKNGRYPGIKGMDIPLFRQQLNFFENNFNVVTMEQVIEAVNFGGSLPENALLLTFDDGYIDNFTVVMPLLQQHHMQGSFFIPGKTITENVVLDVNKIHFILASTDNIGALVDDLKVRMIHYRGAEFDYPSNDELWAEYAKDERFDGKEVVFIKRILQTVLPERLRNIITSELFEKYLGLPEDKFARELYMNHDQIRFMKEAGMHIGFHGYDHYWLANLPEDQMKRDVDKALEVIGDYIDKENWVINYPYGNYNDSVCSYVASKGAKVGVTTEVRIAKIGVDDALTLPRLDCNDFPPKSKNFKELS